MIGSVSHDALQLREALQRTSRPVVLDTETTGLNVRIDRILSLGLRVHANGLWQNFVLFAEFCTQRSIRPYRTPWLGIRSALAPLERPEMILIGHNIKYDVLMLRREGVEYHDRRRPVR